MARLSGINLALQTPFFDDGQVDEARWLALIDTYIECGVHGLVLGSGTGQYPYLTEGECAQLYAQGIERVAGRCQVICQTSALNMQDLLRRSRDAEAMGADALMVMPPYLEGPADDDGLFAFYRDVDAAVGIDIVGYNIPQATGVTITPTLLRRLGQLQNFKYIKDSSGDMAAHQAFIGIEGVAVLNGADPLTPWSFMAGSVGAIWGCANYMPRESVRLWELIQTGEHQPAIALWRRMLPSVLWMWGDHYIPAMKVATRLRGFDGGALRSPLRPISQSQADALAMTLSALDG